MITSIYLVRHGETDLNTQGRLQGWVDHPLNQNGIDLAKVTGEALADIPFDLAISSTLVRAAETARLVTAPSARKQGREIPLYQDPRLVEIGFGEWEECLCVEGSHEISLEAYSVMFTDPFRYVPPKGGESIRQVCDRTAAFWEDLLANPEWRGKRILVCAHGCSVRSLLYYMSEDPEDFWGKGVPRNCSVSLAQSKDGGRPVLVYEGRIYYDPALSVNPYKAVKTRSTH